MHVLKFKREIKSQASEFLAINQHKAPCRNRTKVDSIDATSKYYFSPLVIGCRQTNDLCSYKTQDSFQIQKLGSPDLNYSIDMIRKNALWWNVLWWWRWWCNLGSDLVTVQSLIRASNFSSAFLLSSVHCQIQIRRKYSFFHDLYILGGRKSRNQVHTFWTGTKLAWLLQTKKTFYFKGINQSDSIESRNLQFWVINYGSIIHKDFIP